MKVNIGPYTTWIGPYQIADWLQHIGVSEDRCHSLGTWLSSTWVGDVLQKLHNLKKRRVVIRIDDYDVWSADNTIALIAHPLLLKLAENKQGAPFVDDADVPEHLRSTAAPAKENEWDTDANHFVRWDWVLEEMLFAMGEIANGKTGEEKFYDHSSVDKTQSISKQVDAIKIDRAGVDAYTKRVQNGCRLFGVYFQNLWT